MLERWVERLPEKQRRDTVARMRRDPTGTQQDEIQFNAAFFELFLHEFLLGTRGEVKVEPMIDELTPDFEVTEELADASQLTYVVEATDIDLERGTKLKKNWNELTVLDTLAEISSPDFHLHIRMEGKLESSPRKAQIRQKFEKLLRETKYEEVLRISQGNQGFKLEHLPCASFSHGSWIMAGYLLPVSPEHRGKTMNFVGSVSMGADYVNDIGKTKDRLERKAKRYKNVDNLIVAFRCDISNNRLDEVLFGSQQYTFHVHPDPANTTPLPEPYYSQKLNGFWFNPGGPTRQHVIGVVAFYGIHPGTLDRSKAVFYSNPYLAKPKV